MIRQNGQLQQALHQLYLHTCELDVQSLKPGNISMYSNAKDLSVDDFLNSARASVDSITDPAIESLGQRIFQAIEATQRVVSSNTNLGMILLIAPLIQARYEVDNKVGSKSNFREVLHNILQRTTVEDARAVYRAIRLANPGGMGRSKDQDLAEEPTVSLLNTMKISSNRDQVAAQYVNNFETIFKFGVPHYQKLLKQWNDEKWATTGLFLGYLANYPDSLIERKFGQLKAREISDMISGLEMELCRSDLPGRYEAQLLKIDRQLKRDLINPGTTADLTAASIFAAGLDN